MSGIAANQPGGAGILATGAAVNGQGTALLGAAIDLSFVGTTTSWSWTLIGRPASSTNGRLYSGTPTPPFSATTPGLLMDVAGIYTVQFVDSASVTYTLVIVALANGANLSPGYVYLQTFSPIANDLGPAFASAIAALPPEGGTIDASTIAPGGTVLTAFTSSKNLKILLPPGTMTFSGSAQITMTAASLSVWGSVIGSTIQCPNAELVILKGNYVTTSGNGFDFTGVQFLGGGTSSKLIDLSIVRSPVLTMSNARMIIRDCTFSTFTGQYVITTGTSNFYLDCFDSNFYGNYGSIKTGQQSDSRIIGCTFTGGTLGSHSLYLQGPTVFVDKCEFFRSAWSDPTVYDDIRLDPQVSNIYGGRIKILNCKFGGENDWLNPLRSKIGCQSSVNASYFSESVEISGCWLDGHAPYGAVMTRAANVVTCTLTNLDNVTPRQHGMTNGQTISVVVSQSVNATFNTNSVTATASGTNTLTWTLAGANGSTTGVLQSRSDISIRLTNPPTRWSIHDSQFQLGGYCVDDAFTLALTDTGVDSPKRDNSWHCRFERNFLVDPYGAAPIPFKNGGKGFDVVESLATGGDVESFGTRPIRPDPIEVRNRLQFSESLGTAPWTVVAGVTVTMGQVTTVVALTDLFTANAHGFIADMPVVFTNSGGALPTPLTAATTYYISASGLTTNNYKISTSVGGAVLDITGAGSGTNTIFYADPNGGVAAARINRTTTWTPGLQCFYQQLDITNLRSSVTVGFYAKKSGTTSSCFVGIVDNPQSAYVRIDRFVLTADWQYFQFTVRGITPGHAHQLEFYPESIDNIPGDFLVALPCVRDYELGSYIITKGAAVADTSISYAPGRGTLRRFWDFVASPDLSSTTQPVLSGATGLDTGTVTLGSGACDQAGTITLNPTGAPGNSGLVTLTFNVPIPNTKEPGITLTAQDGSGAWQNQVALRLGPAITVGTTVTAFQVVWSNNGVNLTAANSYKIAYQVQPTR